MIGERNPRGEHLIPAVSKILHSVPLEENLNVRNLDACAKR